MPLALLGSTDSETCDAGSLFDSISNSMNPLDRSEISPHARLQFKTTCMSPAGHRGHSRVFWFCHLRFPLRPTRSRLHSFDFPTYRQQRQNCANAGAEDPWPQALTMANIIESRAAATDSRSYVMIVVISAMLSFVVAMVGLRLYTRARHVRSIGLSDWVIILALVHFNSPALVEKKFVADRVRTTVVYRRYWRGYGRDDEIRVRTAHLNLDARHDRTVSDCQSKVPGIFDRLICKCPSS